MENEYNWPLYKLLKGYIYVCYTTLFESKRI